MITIGKGGILYIQAIVDYRDRFWNVHVGWPGKVHDATVLSNSIIYRSGDNGTLFPDWTETINGRDVPICLNGDPAYPLLNWLMKAQPLHRQRDNLIIV